MQVVQKFDPEEGAPRPNPAGPFPNLRCREVVKALATRVVDVTTFCKFTDQDASLYALAFLQGVRTVADDLVLQRFVLGLIDKVNQDGAKAVRELVEAVSGHPLKTALGAAA